MHAISGSRYDMLVRQTVTMVGVIGAIVFASLLAISWLYPTALETWARNAIAHEVRQRVETQLDGLSNSAAAGAASRLIAKNNRDIMAARAHRAQQLPSNIAVVMTLMLDPDCPCRDAPQGAEKQSQILAGAKKADSDAAKSTIVKLERVNAALTELIAAKYRDVSRSLLREVRIFSGANATVFLLLAAAACLWRGNARRLLAPAIVLVGAASITAMTYLFNQDWLQTILLNDYVGLWYFPYLGLALAFMGDVVFNRARVSLQLAQAAGLAAGGVLSAGC